MPPALLQLFTPRPTIEFKPPPPREPKPKLTGFGEYVSLFTPRDKLEPLEKVETAKEKKARIRKLKMEKHAQILAERIKSWDPHSNKNATGDAYKTLFVARLSYDVTEEDLRDDFSRYGDVRDVKLIRDNNGKSRGYAFIEFETSQDLKDAFKYADGKPIKGRRILVDVERGRTVPGWKPRKLGGGMGSSRGDDKDRKSKDEDSDRYRSRRDKYRDRDYRDRDRGRRRRSRDRGRRRSRSRERRRH